MEREFVYTCRNCGTTYKREELVPGKIIDDVLTNRQFKVPREYLYNTHNCHGNGHGGYGVADLITIIPG